jgi:hypothetical protein
MWALLVLSTAATAPVVTTGALPCDGIRMIEAATKDRPRAFASLREQGKTLAFVRNAAGQRVQREVTVTNVKAISGFSSCRFVYSANIDLACYVGTTFADSDEATISTKLTSTAENIGNCLTNSALVRSESEAGSTPSVTFGAGPNQPFWQISMVPSGEDSSRIQPEILVLGPTVAEPVPRAPRARAKARRKTR